MKRITKEQYEEKFLKERKDFITYSCENNGIVIYDSRIRLSITKGYPLKLITSKKWRDAYLYLESHGLLKTN